jgi:hypothetical protein
MDVNDIVEFLDAYAKEFDLINEAVYSCQEAIENCLDEETNRLAGFLKEEIVLRYEKQELQFNNRHSLEPCVATYIDILHSKNGKVAEDETDKFGDYIFITNLQGEVVDEVLITDDVIDDLIGDIGLN